MAGLRKSDMQKNLREKDVIDPALTRREISGLRSRVLAAEMMDEERQKYIAYQYLCRLAEAKDWIERCINENIPVSTGGFEDALQNGVLLAKLSNSFAPNVIPLKKIYDIDEAKFKAKGLHFKHTQNFNYWIGAMDDVKFPKIFHPETVDLYDQKNMPKVIYCIHAMALYLCKLGKAPAMSSLSGKVIFTDEEIMEKCVELQSKGVQMPMFNRIGGILTSEAIKSVNRAVDDEDSPQTVVAMNHIAARLADVNPDYAEFYQNKLFAAKQSKITVANENLAGEEATEEEESESDDERYFDRNLTHKEIQHIVNDVNEERNDYEIHMALLAAVNAINEGDLLTALKNPLLRFTGIDANVIHMYRNRLQEVKTKRNQEGEEFTWDDIQNSINEVNAEILKINYQQSALQTLNNLLDSNPINVQKLKDCLANEYFEFKNLDLKFTEQYGIVMRRGRLEKVAVYGYGEEGLVTAEQVQNMIDKANVLRELNQSLDQEPADDVKLRECLQSSILDLQSVDNEKFSIYSTLLKDRRTDKILVYGNNDKSLLYLDEAQRLILQTNCLFDLNGALKESPIDEDKIYNLLVSADVDLENVKRENVAQYVKIFTSLNEEKEATFAGSVKDTMLTSKDLQKVISRENSLLALDETLLAESIEIPKVRESLRSKALNLQNLHMELCNFYAISLKEKRQSKDSDSLILREGEVQYCIDEANALQSLNECIMEDTVDLERFTEYLSSDILGLPSVDSDHLAVYATSLTASRQQKIATYNESSQNLLGKKEIESAVSSLNVVIAVNKCLDQYPSNRDELNNLLQDPTLTIEKYNDQALDLYVALMKDLRGKMTSEDNALLRLEDIQKCASSGSDVYDATLNMVKCTVAVNNSFNAGNEQELLEALRHEFLSLQDVNADLIMEYKDAMKSVKNEREDLKGNWISHECEIFSNCYFNLTSGCLVLEAPNDYVANGQFLTRKEIKEIINTVNERFKFYEQSLPKVIAVQAYGRGYLARKAMKLKKNELASLVPAIIKIQAAFKGFRQRRNYRDRLAYLEKNREAVVKVQSVLRCLNIYKNYKLLTSNDVTFKAISLFCHLLDESHKDFEEEFELQKLRSHIVTNIRANQKLEKDLSAMDIKIGLLVKNRITLQDVVHQNRVLKKISKGTDTVRGLHTLVKEKRLQLEGYQSLFYLLQTEPMYLAKLIFAIPQSRSNKFVETAILTIFNYAANSREEFLLIKLFNAALQEEVKNRVSSFEDFVESNPLVIKLAIQFNRGSRSQDCLKEIFSSVIQPVMNTKDEYVVDSVAIYKQWIQRLESTTGEASQLPHDLTAVEAIKYPEVKTILNNRIDKLKSVIGDIIAAILPSADKLPYALRCVAMTLRKCLEKNFPDDQDIAIKAVGNFLLYRYMNPALIAPDAFDIVPFDAKNPLSSQQRHNLSSVANILQRAAVKELYSDENTYLALNEFLSQSYQKLRTFFIEASTVEDVGEHFQLDQYSEYCMLRKPTIYISVREICNIHKLVVDFETEISSNTDDPLHEVLSDLGAPLSEAELIEVSLDTNDPIAVDAVTEDLAKTEVYLTLNNRFDIKGDNKTSDLSSLFNGTKNLIEDIVRVQKGSSLSDVLCTPASQQESTVYTEIVIERAYRMQRISQVTQNQMEEEWRKSMELTELQKSVSIQVAKERIQESLQALEDKNLTSAADGYKTILRAIAKDISKRRLYRENRTAELEKLRETLQVLTVKMAMYEEQVDKFNEYTKSCIENMATAAKKKKSITIKYTAARLHEKNIIQSITGLQSNQYKNVSFEITSTDDPSKFKVNAKFVQKTMESVQLDFEHLLELQYEGVAVIKIFKSVTFNINFLINLLNRKFYGKEQ